MWKVGPSRFILPFYKIRRKKREIGETGYVRGSVAGTQKDGQLESQCNSLELSELIKKHVDASTAASAKTAIYHELDTLYPDENFTVLCVDGSVSYQADSQK